MYKKFSCTSGAAGVSTSVESCTRSDAACQKVRYTNEHRLRTHSRLRPCGIASESVSDVVGRTTIYRSVSARNSTASRAGALRFGRKVWSPSRHVVRPFGEIEHVAEASDELRVLVNVWCSLLFVACSVPVIY